MKANLRLERIGGEYMGLSGPELLTWRMCSAYPGGEQHRSPPKSRDWVAEIVGFDARYGYKRKFIHGKSDYARSNARATRGLYINYILESGHLYEVASPQSWKQTKRYFATVTDDGDVVEILKEVVDQCLKDHLESTSAQPQDSE